MSERGFISVAYTVASCLSDTHCTVSPAQFDLVHHPQFMDVLGKLLPDPLQVRWQHNLHTNTGKQLL